MTSHPEDHEVWEFVRRAPSAHDCEAVVVIDGAEVRCNLGPHDSGDHKAWVRIEWSDS